MKKKSIISNETNLGATRICEGHPFCKFIGWEFIFFSFRRRRWLEEYTYRFRFGQITDEPLWKAMKFLD